MTPKEKAQELTDAFYQYLPIEQHVITSDRELSWEYDGWENAKQCALIAIEEIIKANPYEINKTDMDSTIDYWQEVKQEIEKL